MTVAAYRSIGGLQGALKNRADDVLGQFDGARRDLCRRIFLRLTQPGEGTPAFSGALGQALMKRDHERHEPHQRVRAFRVVRGSKDLGLAPDQVRGGMSGGPL